MLKVSARTLSKSRDEFTILEVTHFFIEAGCTDEWMPQKKTTNDALPRVAQTIYFIISENCIEHATTAK